ncbi:DUF2946 family protein [Pseudomonas juntendi]|uniref:DUF2946 family protein n=1 Tax=Pseudomonas juntendi TaxID=2666183 RepID=A0A7W2JJF4_9PSED|nr:DUF2946 family protein [Pseudomonas juntendi]MBA6060044.1 DUF2946 family protein [Pseudomonas juntendi]MBA6127011.1 DUF2946 family protein [Pseudomonas juntendi]
MNRCGLRPRTWDNLWVAALLAMLLKVLALPMASTLGDLSLAQLLAGSYCSSGGVQPALADKDGNLSPKASDPGHCCCAQGGPAPLPAALVLATVPVQALQTALVLVSLACSPRHCWPSINPRASPMLIA